MLNPHSYAVCETLPAFLSNIIFAFNRRRERINRAGVSPVKPVSLRVKCDWLKPDSRASRSTLNSGSIICLSTESAALFKNASSSEDRFKSNDINKYGGSSTENPFDLIYVPGFIESAIEKGYDCVEGWDEFFQGSIYIYIPLDPKKVEIIDTKIFKPTDLDSE